MKDNINLSIVNLTTTHQMSNATHSLITDIVSLKTFNGYLGNKVNS